MSAPSCSAPLAWDRLLTYWLAELDAERDAEIEQHYLGCASCSERLAWLAALARRVRVLVDSSALNTVLEDRFVRRLREQGLQVREYRVPCNGSVNCTVAPDDDLVVGRLEAPLADVSRVDLMYLDDAGRPAARHEDVPFVAQSGAVVLSTRIATLRALPRTTVRIRLLAVEPDGERTLGDYAFHHTPFGSEDA